jgi:toxin YoeB
MVFEGDTWEAYEALRTRDRLLHRNLCRILKELQRGDPSVGTGKPEAGSVPDMDFIPKPQIHIG